MSNFLSRRAKPSGMTPKYWVLVIACNVLISAGVGAGAYYWTMSRISSDIATEDMADDEKTDEEEIPDSDNPADTTAAKREPEQVAVIKPAPVAQASAVSECDSLASDPDDPNRAKDEDGSKIPGVPGSQLDIRETLAKCPASKTAITAGMPVPQLRTQHQRARAYFQSGKYEQAREIYVPLCTADYGASCFRLAEALHKGIGDFPQDDSMAYKYAQRAANANVAAAGEFMQELGPLINPWVRTQARGLVEPLFKGALNEIPDTVSTRRYFYTLFTQSEKQNGQWYTNLMSNQDHMHATQTIWPVLETRLALSVEEAKKVYSSVVTRSSGVDDWRSIFGTTINGVIEARTLLQNANSVQVAVGAQDAQKLFEWFSGCGSCNLRETFVRNLGELMNRWSASKPGADDGAKICPLMFREQRPNCLPLPDYEGTEGGKTLDFIKKPGGAR